MTNLQAGRSEPLVLGLDWDGTISCFAEPLAVLSRHANHVVIITVNDEITPSLAAETLGIAHNRIVIEVCPDERIEDYALWKAERCRTHGVMVMIDDDEHVVAACVASGIPALLVAERPHPQPRRMIARLSGRGTAHPHR